MGNEYSFVTLKKFVKVPEQFEFSIRRNLQMIDDRSITIDECMHSMYQIGIQEYIYHIGTDDSGILLPPERPEEKHMMKVQELLTKISQNMLKTIYERGPRIAFEQYYMDMEATFENISREAIDDELIKRLNLLGIPDELDGFIDMLNKAVEVEDSLRKEVLLPSLETKKDELIKSFSKFYEQGAERLYEEVVEFFKVYFQVENGIRGKEFLQQDNVIVRDDHILYVLNLVGTGRLRFGKVDSGQ